MEPDSRVSEFTGEIYGPMSSAAHVSRVGLAKFSRWSYLALSVALMLAGSVPFMWYLELKDSAHFLDSVYQQYALISATIIFPVLAILTFKIARQVLFDERWAIWLENDCVIYLDPGYLKVPCADISKMFFDIDSYRREGITLLLRDGSKKFLFTGGLSTSDDEIMRHLKEITGLG